MDMIDLQDYLLDILSHIERLANIIRHHSSCMRSDHYKIVSIDLLCMNKIIRTALLHSLTQQEIDNGVREKQKHLK